MAGSTVAVAALVAVAITGSTAVAATGAVARAQQLGHAADAAALAAGDVLLGWAPGEPCDAAAALADAHDAVLESCAVEGVSVRVTVGARVLGVGIARSARAGAP